MEESSARADGCPSVPDFIDRETRMLEAIEAMQKTSMTAILEAIGNIDLNVTVGGRKLAHVDAVEALSASQSRQQHSPSCGPRAPSSPLSPQWPPLDTSNYSAGTSPRPTHVMPDTGGGGGYSPSRSTQELTPSRSTPELVQSPARQEY